VWDRLRASRFDRGEVLVKRVRGLETLVQNLWCGDASSERGFVSRIGVVTPIVARRRSALVR
jgi:hypothetical protein